VSRVEGLSEKNLQKDQRRRIPQKIEGMIALRK
jgi:hypothetical protein